MEGLAFHKKSGTGTGIHYDLGNRSFGVMELETKGKYKYELHLQIGTGETCGQHDTLDVEDLGFTNEEWDELTEKSRQDILDESRTEWANGYIDSYWEMVG